MSTHERVLGPFLVTVNRSLSMIEMIAAGRYDNYNHAVKAITEWRFPINRTGELIYMKELFLVLPTSPEIIFIAWQAEMKQEEWMQEQTPECLALGAQHPSLQLEHKISAFGSEWLGSSGRLHSPALWRGYRGREASTVTRDPELQCILPFRALVSRELR